MSLLCVFVSLGLVSCQNTDSSARKVRDQRLDLIESLVREPDLSIFLNYLQKSRSLALLKTKSPITIYVPLNSAFDSVKATWDNKLRAAQGKGPNASSGIESELEFHMLRTRFDHGQQRWHGQKIATAEGHEILIQKTGVNDAKFVNSNAIDCSNGRIYVIDRVLRLPSSARGAAEKALTHQKKAKKNNPDKKNADKAPDAKEKAVKEAKQGSRDPKSQAKKSTKNSK